MAYPISINDLVDSAHKYAVSRGFWDNLAPSNVTVRLSKLALITSEIGECVEAIRVVDGNIAEELADVVIRVFDLAGALDIDLEQAILDKMNRNETTRTTMHGKLA